MSRQSSLEAPDVVVQLISFFCTQTTLVNVARASRQFHRISASFLYRDVAFYMDIKLPRKYKQNRSLWFLQASEALRFSLIDTRLKLNLFADTMARSPHLRRLLRTHRLCNLTDDDIFALLESYLAPMLKDLVIDSFGLEGYQREELWRLAKGPLRELVVRLRVTTNENGKNVVRASSNASEDREYLWMAILPDTLYGIYRTKNLFSFRTRCLEIICRDCYTRTQLFDLGQRFQLGFIRHLMLFAEKDLSQQAFDSFLSDAQEWVVENRGLPNVMVFHWNFTRHHLLLQGLIYVTLQRWLSLLRSFRGLKEFRAQGEVFTFEECEDIFRCICFSLNEISVKHLNATYLPWVLAHYKGFLMCSCQNCVDFLQMVRGLKIAPTDKKLRQLLIRLNFGPYGFAATSYNHVSPVLQPHFRHSISRSGSLLCEPKDEPRRVERQGLEYTSADEVFSTFWVHQFTVLLASLDLSTLNYCTLDGIAFERVNGAFQPVFDEPEYPPDWKTIFSSW